MTDAQHAVIVRNTAHVRLQTFPPVDLTMLHKRVEAHVLRKKSMVRRGLVPPTMAAAVLATSTDRRMITTAAVITASTVNTAAAVDGEAGAGVDLPEVVVDAAGRLKGRVGAGAIDTMVIILAGGATAAADLENVAGAAEVGGTAIVADPGAAEEMLTGEIGPEIAIDPTEKRGATEILAEADGHTVGAGAENATGIATGIGIGTEIGESGQRRAVADRKKAVAAERMHEISSALKMF